MLCKVLLKQLSSAGVAQKSSRIYLKARVTGACIITQQLKRVALSAICSSYANDRKGLFIISKHPKSSDASQKTSCNFR